MPADPRRVIISALAVAIALAVPALVAAQEDGLRESSTSTYTLLPDEGRVRANIVVTLVNRRKAPLQRWGPIWSPEEARNVEFKGSGVTVETVVNDTGSLDTAVFDPLRRKQKQKIRANYDLVDAEPGSRDPTLVGTTYARFCWGGEATDTGTIEAILPARWSATTEMGEVVRDDTTIRATSDELPGTFYACTDAFTVSLDSRIYVLGPSEQVITLDSWPEDPAWEPTMLGIVGNELGSLETLIGLPMAFDELTIQEAARIDPFGSSSDFLPLEALLLLDRNVSVPGIATVALARTWFNDATISDSWLVEGLARWSGLAASGLECPASSVFPGGDVANLSDWYVRSGKPFEWDLARLDYQGAAACRIVEETAEALGPEAMTSAITKLLASTGSADAASWLEAIDQQVAEAETPAAEAPDTESPLQVAERLLLEYGITTPSP